MNEVYIPYAVEDDELAYLTSLRRAFHTFPEPGFAEFWTTAKICEMLQALGYELTYGDALYDQAAQEKIAQWGDEALRNAAYEAAKVRLPENPRLPRLKGGYTGVIACLKGRAPGPRIGFRVDIDGLPLQESHNSNHAPFAQGFASTNANMHACGHDGHIAIGLGLAKTIREHIESLPGEYYFFFQPAEELIAGGVLFSTLDIVRRLDYFIPLHLGLIEQRKIVCGVSFLAATRFNVTFTGESAHAGICPEQGHNALLAACHAVTALYGIPRHGDGVSRINVGEFVSQNASNVISDHATFEFEVRGQTMSICDYLTDQAQRIVHGAAGMQGVDTVITPITESITADNSRELTGQIKEAAMRAGIDEQAVVEEFLVLGSEDATFLMHEVQKHGGQAAYVCIGSPTYGGHHTPTFDFDEDLLVWGVRVLWEWVKGLTSSEGSGRTRHQVPR